MGKTSIIEWENEIRSLVIAKGEKEDTPGSYRMWVSNLNGVVNFNGHTDILSVLVDTDGNVLAHVNTPDDMSSTFEYLDSLPYKVVKEILNQARHISSQNQ